MKNWKLDRIISIATLVTSLVAIYLVVKKPRPVAQPQAPAVAAANAESFQKKLQELDKPKESESAPAPEVHISSDEVSAALAQAAGEIPAAAVGEQPLTPDTDVGSGLNILDQQVSFDGDQVHGQFLTKVAGKDVWITISGHLGSKDGYATFDPTEFKVGDMSVPVSLVNGPLQKRLEEERDRLKLSNNVAGVKVENGELVLNGK
jgi:hypothetical protein